MTGLLEQLAFFAPGWRDLLEIVIVTAVFYRLLILIAGTRAVQMLLGLLFLVGIYFISRVLALDLLTYLLERMFQFGAIALLVVFHPELRNALAHLGQNRILRVFNRLEQTEVVEEIAAAAEELSRNKVGAIIAIEREVGLGEYIGTGTPLRARVSAPLLNTIFSPYSPLHDGAAIIQGDTIVAAGAILPLTQFPVADKTLGTRHRAALGLSEETDAVVIVVSEETSVISLFFRGQMQRGLDGDRLAAALAAHTRGPALK